MLAFFLPEPKMEAGTRDLGIWVRAKMFSLVVGCCLDIWVRANMVSLVVDFKAVTRANCRYLFRFFNAVMTMAVINHREKGTQDLCTLFTKQHFDLSVQKDLWFQCLL